MKFTVTILGSGAATPTLRRFPTSQLVNCNERFILIDCGEGAQIQLRRFKQKFQKIDVILISHLHGDHYFGLVGLISSFILLGRTKKLQLFCPVGLEKIVRAQLEIKDGKIPFEIEFVEIDLQTKELLYEDKVLEIHGFPLNHKIPTTGFEIREKKKARNFIKHKLEELNISIKEIGELKNGGDLYRDDQLIPKSIYSTDSPEPRSYLFCSDNRIQEKQIPFFEGADLVYHEATFLEKENKRAKSTYHSTAKQVGRILKEANITNLLLGHFSARYDDPEEHKIECQAYISNTICVEDGDQFEIKEKKVEKIVK